MKYAMNECYAQEKQGWFEWKFGLKLMYKVYPYNYWGQYL